jgi:hypothetical protein
MHSTRNSNQALDYRKFGLMLGLLLIVFFSVLPSVLHAKALASWPFLLAIPLVLLAIFAPARLSYLHWAWIRLGGLLGTINTTILLLGIYIIVITPLAIIVRMVSRKSKATRVVSEVRSKESLKMPF